MSGDREEDVGTYTLQVSIDDFRDDTDTTGTVEVGGSVTGEIEAQGDQDWFAVTLEAGKTYQIDMEGSPTGRRERWKIRFFIRCAMPMVTCCALLGATGFGRKTCGPATRIAARASIAA